MVTDELSRSSHVQSIYSKANSTLSFLRRNLRRCPAKLKQTAYIALVRSTLEYAAPVWDPHLATTRPVTHTWVCVTILQA